MKRLRLILAGGFFAALLTAAPALAVTSSAGHLMNPSAPSMRVPPQRSGSDFIVAETVPDEGLFQAPVIEGEELPDVPAADAAAADKEAQMPRVEQPPAGVDVPGADRPPEVPQPDAMP